MITLAIIVLLSTIVISSLFSSKAIENERMAQDALKGISRGYEAFSAKHNGNFNETVRNLANPGMYNPSFIPADYSSGEYRGYNFSCTANNAGYVCNARPAAYKETGSKSFAICTGGILREAAGSTQPACP